MTADYDDLLGPTDPPPPKPKRGPNAPPAPGKRRRGRPTKAEAAAHAAKKAAELAEQEPDDAVDGLAKDALPDAAEFLRPVTRTFLATILGIEPRRLVKRLAKCPVVGYSAPKHGAKVPLYDFKEAIAHVVDPKIDIGDWVKTQNAMSLPPAFSKAFWDAMRSRQMVEERGKDLWRTEDVLEVLGRTALNIKDTAKLWIENLPQKDDLTPEQYAALTNAVADLLDDVHQRLVDMPNQRRTRASVAEIEGMLGNNETQAETD